MKSFLFTFIIITTISNFKSFAKNAEVELQKVYDLYSEGKYSQVLDYLEKIENINDSKKIDTIINYWKAITNTRLNEFPIAIELFEECIKDKYIPDDLYYEYGQALYVSEKLLEARVAFKRSFKRNFKKGVSLYYIAFISQTLKDDNKAVSFYHQIEKLSDDEKKDVIQAARMQIGDIYWKKIKERPNVYSALQKYVIPQYEKALEWDDESSLANEIKNKIDVLKRRYDIEIFQMRNGRNTSRPPFFLKVNTLYGNDDNVNLLDSDTIASKDEEVGANYYNIGFFGRYTFYPNSTYSIAPELRASSTTYQSEVSDIFANDNYIITTAIKFNYEKTYNNAPATTYLDLLYTTQSDDADADKNIEANYNQFGISISEERQFFLGHPTTFRLKYAQTNDETETQSFNMTSILWEQLMIFNWSTIYVYSAYDISRYPEADTSNTDILTVRTDFIFPTFYKLFNPIIYFSNIGTNYINNDNRGSTSLTTLGMSINRPFGKNWYMTLDYSDSSQTGELDTDIYKQKRVSFNLDYIY